jgi:hypothetical protein
VSGSTDDAPVAPGAGQAGHGGPRGHRLLDDVRARAQRGGAEGAAVASRLGAAAEALHLEVVETKLDGPRALVGHVLGMRLLVPAQGLHGPRETPVLLYLFRDALAVRPTDDAPMSAVPIVGLHLLLPDVAIAHWLYKLGRTAHANVELVKDEGRVEASLDEWTVDDFASADPKLRVFPVAARSDPVRLYESLGFVRLVVPVAGDKPVRLKSNLPEPSKGFVHLWEVFNSVTWPHGLSMEPPRDEPAGDA